MGSALAKRALRSAQVGAAGPRAAIEAAAPNGGAATTITWGLRIALLRR